MENLVNIQNIQGFRFEGGCFSWRGILVVTKEEGDYNGSYANQQYALNISGLPFLYCNEAEVTMEIWPPWVDRNSFVKRRVHIIDEYLESELPKERRIVLLPERNGTE